jgi:hypothetical protein
MRHCRVHFAPRFLDGRSVAAHVGQSERQCRLVNVAQHLPEERFVLLTAHAQPRLRHEVPERQRLRQLFRLPQQMRMDFPLDNI